MYRKGKLFLKFINYWVFASSGKGHGIHSPFVFDFVIQVLCGCKNESVITEIDFPAIGNKYQLKYQKLIARIRSYYSDYDVRLISLLQINDLQFSNSGNIFDSIPEKIIHIVTDIRSTINAEKTWVEIKKNEKVTCSIDLFFVGILFFKKDFKEKLDFMIRF